MEYRAVNGRCAVILKELQLPMSDEEALDILFRSGFTLVDVDLNLIARDCVRESRYRRGARPSEAPSLVDCSSFVKWLYGQRGIWLPRRSIQQRSLGIPVPQEELRAGDLVFVSGYIDYYLTNTSDGVGHVGILSDTGTVFQAADRKRHVIETSLEDFVGTRDFRGARRYIPEDACVLTFNTPERREVEIADDLRWIILQSLPRRVREKK